MIGVLCVKIFDLAKFSGNFIKLSVSVLFRSDNMAN